MEEPYRRRYRLEKWSTGTVIVATFLGFAVGFMACHELYKGL